MPVLGVLILLAQIACAVHVVRTGRNYFWIYVVVFVPLVGMAAYFFAEILPEMLRSRSARRAASGMVQAIDPGRELRQAMREVEIAPTAQNRSRLAAAFLAAGQADRAIALYRDALVGVHATDPAMMLGLAQALFVKGDMAGTQAVLEDFRAANPESNSTEAQLLYARCLEEQGKDGPALAEYATLAPIYPGQEARCRYAMLLARNHRAIEARPLFQEICRALELGPRHQYRQQREWYDIAKRELAALGQ
jgi:hypothetical protein